MDRTQLIEQLDDEITRLRKARAVLIGGHDGPFPALDRRRRRGPRTMSAEARARISAAQKKRWAKVKAGKK